MESVWHALRLAKYQTYLISDPYFAKIGLVYESDDQGEEWIIWCQVPFVK